MKWRVPGPLHHFPFPRLSLRQICSTHCPRHRCPLIQHLRLLIRLRPPILSLLFLSLLCLSLPNRPQCLRLPTLWRPPVVGTRRLIHRQIKDRHFHHTLFPVCPCKLWRHRLSDQPRPQRHNSCSKSATKKRATILPTILPPLGIEALKMPLLEVVLYCRNKLFRRHVATITAH
jgi:hypothetical protein